MSINLIGDVHGKYDRYLKIANSHPYTIQLGDFGFKYEILENLDPDCHKILGGNHDNYDIIHNCPNYLGNYGVATINEVEFFYYRGAYSIDRQHRTVGVDWWEAEQLKIEQFMEARELYRKTKPEIVLTHDCPESISSYLLPPYSKLYQNITGWALNELFNTHQPKIWIFGHYHRSFTANIGGTNFKCLDELESYTI